MQCAEFDDRVHALLDARRPTDEAALMKHADECATCAAVLEGYLALECAVERLPAPRSQPWLCEGAIDALQCERRLMRQLTRAAAVAAALTLAVVLTRGLAPRPPAAAPIPAHAHVARVAASPSVASPSEVLRAAGESWWAGVRASAQPLSAAPGLLPRPDFEDLSEALKYGPERLRVTSWSELVVPFDHASDAFEFFSALPTIPASPQRSIDSSS
jgi:hypothetical protein